MALGRVVMMAAALAGAAAATPASAQFFLRNPNLAGPPMKGDEPELGYSLPGATEAEMRAGLIWSMRAALNVAALQCQFEPTLMSVDNYNALLIDHKTELSKSLDTLTKYFIRTNKNNRAKGVSALDQFGTRLYSGFSTVRAQFIFCLTASSIAREAVFTKRGEFGDLAVARMHELRSSLRPAGEQQFPSWAPMRDVSLPVMVESSCWIKKNKWDTKRCGRQPG